MGIFHYYRCSLYLAVLLGPNCLAGVAEIQGFLLEAGKTPVIQIKTCFWQHKHPDKLKGKKKLEMPEKTLNYSR